MYQRNASNSISQGQSHQLSNFIDEGDEEEHAERYSEDENDIFDMDDVAFKPKASASKPATKPVQQQQPQTQKKATFVVGAEHKSPKPTKNPTPISAIEHLKIAELKPSRAASKSPARMTPNTSFHQLSAIDVALNSSPTHKYVFL